MSEPSRADAERQSALADARLEVAEDFGWLVAILAGFVVYLLWETWLGAISVAILFYLVVTHYFKKEHEEARDVLERLTGTGRYYSGTREEDVS